MESTNKTARAKIMIIDDDKIFREELEEMLNLSGYDITAFADGVSALKNINEIRPDVLILDLKMKEKSGFQIAYELNRLPNLRIPIIAVTGFFTEKEHIRLMDVCGIQTQIIKPFNPLDVISKIEELLQEKIRR